MADKCPWCHATVDREGNTVWVFFDGNKHCGWCQGTGLASMWQKHAEYHRQLADERLTKFRAGHIWPVHVPAP